MKILDRLHLTQYAWDKQEASPGYDTSGQVWERKMSEAA